MHRYYLLAHIRRIRLLLPAYTGKERELCSYRQWVAIWRGSPHHSICSRISLSSGFYTFDKGSEMVTLASTVREQTISASQIHSEFMVYFCHGMASRIHYDRNEIASKVIRKLITYMQINE